MVRRHRQRAQDLRAIYSRTRGPNSVQAHALHAAETPSLRGAVRHASSHETTANEGVQVREFWSQNHEPSRLPTPPEASKARQRRRRIFRSAKTFTIELLVELFIVAGVFYT